MTEHVVLQGLLAYCAYPQTRMAGLVRDCLLIFNIQHRSSSIVCLKTGPCLHNNECSDGWLKKNIIKTYNNEFLRSRWSCGETNKFRQMSWRGFVLTWETWEWRESRIMESLKPYQHSWSGDELRSHYISRKKYTLNVDFYLPADVFPASRIIGKKRKSNPAPMKIHFHNSRNGQR